MNSMGRALAGRSRFKQAFGALVLGALALTGLGCASHSEKTK